MAAYTYTGANNATDNYWSDPKNWTSGFTGSVPSGSTAVIAGPTNPYTGPATVVGTPLIFNTAALTSGSYIYDLVNAGAINFVGGQDWTSATAYSVTAPDLDVWGEVQFSGGGTVSFADLGSSYSGIEVGSGGAYSFPTDPVVPTLENVDNTFTGSAWFSGLGAGLILQNDAKGAVDANAADGMTFYAMKVVNNGALAATGGGELTLDSTTVDQTNAGKTSTGHIDADGANVYLGTATIEGGALNGSGGGIFETGGSATLDGTTSTVTINKGAEIEVNNNQVLLVKGAISSAGEIYLDASVTQTATTTTIVSATLQIGGTVTPGAIVMSDEPGADNTISGGGSNNVLDNKATISGAGEFSGLGSGLSVTNESSAIINANGGNAMTFYGVNTTNNGTLEATSTGGLDLAGVTLDQTGGGALAASGGNVSLYNVTIDGGTLEGTGVIAVTAGSATLDGTKSKVTIDAGSQVAVDANESLTLTGSIANTGTIELNASAIQGAALYIDGDVTPGNIVMSDEPAGDNEIAGGATGNVLDNTASISGAGEFIWYGPGLSVKNEAGATIDANGANAMIFAVNVTNNELMEATGAGGLELQGVTLNQGAAGELLESGGNITFDNATVTGGKLVVASGQTLNGQGGVINAATVTLGANAQASVAGGGNSVAFGGASGNVATLSATSNVWDNVAGSGGTVNLSSAQTVVTGGGDAVAFTAGSGDAASLFGTAGAWDKVTGSNGDVYLNGAQTTLTGGGEMADFASGSGNAASLINTGGSWDWVYGSNGSVYLNNAQAAIQGGGDMVDFASGASDAASLYNTGGNWDWVYATGGSVYLNSGQAAVQGGGETLVFASGSGNAASLYNTGGNWDWVYGSGGSVYLNSAQAAVQGGDNAIAFASGSNDSVSLYNSDGVWGWVYGSNGTISLNNAQTAISGGGDKIALDGNSADAVSLYSSGGAWDAVSGSNGTIYMNGSQASVSGNSDAFDMAGANTVSAYGTSDAFIFGPAIGVDYINNFGSTDTLQFSAKDFANFAAISTPSHMAQSGANTVISLDATDTVTLTNVQMTSLTSSQFKFV